MTQTMPQTGADYQAAAHRNLWMHFAELGAYRDIDIPIISRGEGAYVYDTEGRRYFDGLASLYCVNVGHGRNEIAEAVHRQIGEIDFFPVWNYATPAAVRLSEKIAEIAPGNLNRVFFTNSGSESVETALKLVRQYQRLRGLTDKYKVISRQGAYHGVTMGALSLTQVPDMQAPFAPMVPGSLVAPQVKDFRSGKTPEQNAIDCANELEQVILREGADSVAAVIVEPVQSSGGVLPAHPVYFQRLREICDRHDVLMISDETICSWGRLGHFFGSTAIGYQPDIITTAKAITSAYVPMGAVIVGEHVAEPFLQEGVMFEHGATFGGHPVAAAAALANIEIIERESLNERAVVLGERMQKGFESLFSIPIVGDARGVGFFRAIELVSDRETNGALPQEVLKEWTFSVPRLLLERGLVCRAIHRGAPTFIFSPTLVSTEEDVDRVVEIMGEVLELKNKELS
jgi:adenosylmethionine-8-amino-7-oxononanoate aminotransferase